MAEEEPFGIEVTSTKKSLKEEVVVKEEPLEDEEKDEVLPSTTIAQDDEWTDDWDED